MIYLDNAATTKIDPRVKEEMDKCYSKAFGNPSSFNEAGLTAKGVLENARKKIANVLNSKYEEIYFTGSGTESINLALKGFAYANLDKGNHIIISKIEHAAVLETCKYLEKQGFEITYLDVDKFGLVKVEDLKKSINGKTILVSIMYANNEIGTIQNIISLSKVCKDRGVIFHTDACQAAGSCELDVKLLNVDMMSLNSSKIYGPKGVGCLFIKEGIKLEPIIHGGGQEKGLRSGTENVPGIVGFAKALDLSNKEKAEENGRLINLRDKLIKGIKDSIKNVKLNGHETHRLPNNINISFLDVEGETLLRHLNEFGICASIGSACTSKKIEISHVLNSIGLSDEEARSSLRFTLGKNNTEEDIDTVLQILPKIVETLRKLTKKEYARL